MPAASREAEPQTKSKIRNKFKIELSQTIRFGGLLVSGLRNGGVAGEK
jgi:hypothetical protein